MDIKQSLFRKVVEIKFIIPLLEDEFGGTFPIMNESDLVKSLVKVLNIKDIFISGDYVYSICIDGVKDEQKS